MKMKKRIAAAITLLLFAAMTLASCKAEESAANETGENLGGRTLSEPESPGETKADRVEPDLPDMDFGGKIYRALGNYDPRWIQFVNFEIYAETITGDLVNDAVYNRNQRLENRYNVQIEQDLRENPHTVLQKSSAADEDAYSLAFVPLRFIPQIASTGMFYNLNSLKYLDFEKPWWYKDVNSSLSVYGKLYCTTSDFNLMDKNRTYMLAFNKNMANDCGFENLYGLVYNGKWTVDKMNELCRGIAKDLDGDGEMTIADQWALGMDQTNSFAAFYNGCDNYIVTKDPGGNLVLSVHSERTISSIDKIIPFTTDKTISYWPTDFVGKVDESIRPYLSVDLLCQGRQLFSSVFIHSLQYFTQNSDVDYGVLPFPKYDENQKNYVSFPDPFGSELFMIPAAVQDVDFAAFMLEALSAATKYEVMPSYYEISIKTKYTTDEDSLKMLDLIFGTLRYDLGFIYDWGGVGTLFRDTIPNSGVNNFTSKYEAIESRVLRDMEKTINLFKELP